MKKSETITKYFTETQIRVEFAKLSRLKKIDILWDALSYMKQYNGRSRFLCVALAMGYNNIEGDLKSYFKIR